MQKTSWVLDGAKPKRTNVPASQEVTLLKYRHAFKFDEKTPKAQMVTIESFNEMRQCLLDNGLMESN